MTKFLTTLVLIAALSACAYFIVNLVLITVIVSNII